MKTNYVGIAVLSIAGLGVLGQVPVKAQSFSYSDFSNPSQLQINGNAAAPVNNGTQNVLRLTPATASQAGSAFSLNTVQLGSSASFSTAFSFQITDGDGISDGTSNQPGADGIVFVLNTLSNTVGSLGQGVGYQGIGHSVGIKFDTWDDSTANGFPQDNDPNGNFVAIYTDGSTLTSNDPADYFTPSTILKNGDIWYAWIDFDGLTHELDVRLSDGVDLRPINPQLSETIDLNDSSILGSAPQVYAGFTSGTGGAWDNHDILSWAFNDSFKPIATIGNTPDASATFELLALGLACLGVLARGRLARS
jgi:Legume lectin domain